ncbi:MAG TPA: universal stress protein [Agriterribacter sp.]|nr:universal stress protein [Agriterribacter sp.]
MKIFLAVFDGYRMSDSTIQYAIQVTQAVDGHLVGVFLDDFFYRSYDVRSALTASGNPDKAIQELDEKDKKKRDSSVLLFQKQCSKAGIKYSVHRNTNVAVQELKNQSMFADLIIVNENETFTKYKEKLPTRFIKNVLGDIQCPVMVVPGKYRAVDKIVLLYDGRPSALYAIKLFSYLFGNILDMPIEVFTVNEHSQNLRLPENKLMREFIKRHFPKAQFKIAKGNAEEQIVGYLRDHKENELVVLGAYRRSELSRWFKTSMADILMKELNTPLFIAHSS